MGKSTKIYNIHEAKTNLSKLLVEIEKGEEVIIGRAGTPVAKLVPYSASDKKRKLGQWKGKIKIADDFDEMPEDLLQAFYGQ